MTRRTLENFKKAEKLDEKENTKDVNKYGLACLRSSEIKKAAAKLNEKGIKLSRPNPNSTRLKDLKYTMLGSSSKQTYTKNASKLEQHLGSLDPDSREVQELMRKKSRFALEGSPYIESQLLTTVIFR